MTPWHRGYTPIDRQAWLDFPTYALYGYWVAVPTVLGLYLGLPWWAWLVVALINAPIGFVIFMYTLSHLQHPMGSGDCTEFLEFSNPADAARFKGKRISMEEMYEMYFDGLCDFKNPDLMQVLSQRNEFVTFNFSLSGHLKFVATQWVPELLAHTKKQDIEQVRDHYDRADQKVINAEGEDDFYGCFLDTRMTYTSGITLDGNESLDDMQNNKLALVCSKIGLKQTDKHLDIGCGWGSMVNYSAEKFRHNVTGVTVARNQVAFAERKAKEKGILDNVRYLCMDYRDIPKEKFDKITCLEMAEHVGVKNFQTFLAQVRDLMEDDGVFFMQIAGLRRAFQFEDLIWGLFMAKYIFVGADASMPLGWVVNEVEKAGFEVAHVDTIGVHYSLTIKKWYENWVKNKDKVIAKYGQRWWRIFHLFLAWSSVISGTGPATAFQLTMHKNLNSFNRKRFVSGRLDAKNQVPNIPVDGYGKHMNGNGATNGHK